MRRSTARSRNFFYWFFDVSACRPPQAFRRFCFVFTVASIAIGCRGPLLGLPGQRARHSPHETSIPSVSDVLPAEGSTISPSWTPTVELVHLAFDVLRVDLPLKSVQHSRKIWNHVDELRLEPRLLARLARNGMRVGVATSSSWPAIRTVFEACDARTQRNRMVVQNGVPLTIVVGVIGERETIFSYSKTDRLVGKTLAGGEKLVTLDYQYRPELGSCTDLQISLEVRRDLGTFVWERRGDIIRQMPSYDRTLFSDLTVFLTLRPSEFLIIGPDERAENGYLVGSRFFTRRLSNGQRYETLFCITPQPYRTQAGGQRSS